MFERGKPEENLDLFKQLFFIKPVKRDIYNNKNCFPPQSEPLTAKLMPLCCFEAFLGKFIENVSF